MRFYYGEQNILRALDETEFWKQQESEHAGLIIKITPGLEPQYTAKLEQLGTELHLMNAEAVKYIESVIRSKGMLNKNIQAQIPVFLKKCVEQSKKFVGLMNEMLEHSHTVKENETSQTVIHHMIRESECYIGIVQLITG